MESFYFIASLIGLLSFVTTFHGILGIGIILQNRLCGLSMSSYFLKLNNAASTSQTDMPYFTSLNNKERKKLCLKSLDTIAFLIARQNEAARISNLATDTAESIRHIHDFYRNRPEATKDDFITMNVLLEVPDGGHISKGITGIACYSSPEYFMGIEDGYNQQQFFVIGQNQRIQVPYGEISGLVEEITTHIDEATKFNQNRLEKSFQLSQEALTNESQRNTNICHMDNFSKIRACSSVFTVFAANFIHLSIRNVIRESEDIPCEEVKNSIKLFSSAAASSNFESLLMSSTISMIPCNINSEMDSPSFYLTADQLEAGVVFVFTHLFENGVKKYKLNMRVKNVLGLETILY